jgi:hypothetical protein
MRRTLLNLIFWPKVDIAEHSRNGNHGISVCGVARWFSLLVRQRT